MFVTQNIKYALMSKPLKLLSIISNSKIWASTAIRSTYATKHWNIPAIRPLYNYQSIKFKKTKTSACGPCAPCPPEGKSMTACYEDVKAICPSQCQMLIDVRTPEEIKCLGRIPKSVNIPEEDIDIALKLPDSIFQKKYGSTKPDLDAEIIFYSNNGIRSKHAMIKAMKALYLKYGLRLDAHYLQDSCVFSPGQKNIWRRRTCHNSRNYKAGFTEWLVIQEEKQLEQELAESRKKRKQKKDKSKKKKK